MLGQTIGGDNNRLVLVPNWRECIILAIPIIMGYRVTLLLVERVMHRRFGWLIMCGQRPILQPLRRKQPSPTVRFHDKGIAAGDRIHALCAWRRRVIGCFIERKIWYIVSGPLLLLLIPPDVLFPFRPGTPLRISRSAIIQDAPVGRPGEAPLQIRIAIGYTRCCSVIARFWIDSAIDPGAAGRAAIAFQRNEVWYMGSVSESIDAIRCVSRAFGRTDVVPIDFFQDQECVWLVEYTRIGIWLCRVIVPGQRL